MLRRQVSVLVQYALACDVTYSNRWEMWPGWQQLVLQQAWPPVSGAASAAHITFCGRLALLLRLLVQSFVSSRLIARWQHLNHCVVVWFVKESHGQTSALVCLAGARVCNTVQGAAPESVSPSCHQTAKIEQQATCRQKRV